MTYYKALTENNKGRFSNFDFTPYLPRGKRPGKWTPKINDLELCASGWHGSINGQILEWLNANIFEIEIKGSLLKDNSKFAAQQIRFVRKCEGWNKRTARLFACDCAERVLHIFETKYPNDSRPCKAIEVARRYANGKATSEELTATAVAARGVAWGAAWAAAWATAWGVVWGVVWDATWDAAWDAAWGVVWGAVWDAVWGVAWDATAERRWQAGKLLCILRAK